MTVQGIQYLRVHRGGVANLGALDVACFAGQGPGEVFQDSRKVVGVSQWRVREGAYVSTLLPGASSALLLDLLEVPPPGLAAAIDHHTVSTLAITDVDAIYARLVGASGAWRHQRVQLTA